MARTTKPKPGNPDKACKFPDNPTCPFNLEQAGKTAGPYRYQLGCRGDACRSANREYYRNWRNAKQNGAKVPVKAAKAKKPVKKVAKKLAFKKKSR